MRTTIINVKKSIKHFLKIFKVIWKYLNLSLERTTKKWLQIVLKSLKETKNKKRQNGCERYENLLKTNQKDYFNTEKIIYNAKKRRDNIFLYKYIKSLFIFCRFVVEVKTRKYLSVWANWLLLFWYLSF